MFSTKRRTNYLTFWKEEYYSMMLWRSQLNLLKSNYKIKGTDFLSTQPQSPVSIKPSNWIKVSSGADQSQTAMANWLIATLFLCLWMYCSAFVVFGLCIICCCNMIFYYRQLVVFGAGIGQICNLCHLIMIHRRFALF